MKDPEAMMVMTFLEASVACFGGSLSNHNSNLLFLLLLLLLPSCKPAKACNNDNQSATHFTQSGVIDRQEAPVLKPDLHLKQQRTIKP
uniref:Secreted protein n=1 Tax=Mesocestoides corti TaxID=53468 RepID=A0A5K3FZF5_MESCO